MVHCRPYHFRPDFADMARMEIEKIMATVWGCSAWYFVADYFCVCSGCICPTFDKTFGPAIGIGIDKFYAGTYRCRINWDCSSTGYQSV
jgi:hypothetical protein